MAKVEKWIIINDEMRIGFIDTAAELTDFVDGIKGGGHFQIHKKLNKLYLFGASKSFGKCSIEDVRDIKTNGYYSPSLSGLTWIFSESDTFLDSVINGIQV